MMVSFSKMARAFTSSPSQVLNMISTLYKNLGSLFYSSCFPPCAGDYDSRKLGHELSRDGVRPEFEVPKNYPSGVFRNTQGEILGLGAGKNKFYKNPEYFSYHHMSFFDMNMALRKHRLPAPKSGRKPT